MGKGRAPCCDKSKVKRGPWSGAEDLKLITFIQKHGHDNWRALPKQAGLLRCGKSCRLRWINYLRPDVKRGNFTPEEELTIIRLHSTLGNKWSKIASYLPGRTDNEIKNVWNTHLKKKLSWGSGGDGMDKVNRECNEESPVGSSASSSSRAIMSSGKRSSDDEHPPKPMEAHESSEIISSTSEGAVVTMKEQSSSSCSSDKSNIASDSSQADAGTARPEHQMGSSAFEFGRLDFNNLEEVNKPDTVISISDPFEYDYDFWSMLDNLGTLQSNETDASQISKSTSFGEASRETIDSRKWFQDLEHELGLREATASATTEDGDTTKVAAATEDGDSTKAAAAADPKSPETYETLLKPDVDPGITYFQLWNASTQSSAS